MHRSFAGLIGLLLVGGLASSPRTWADAGHPAPSAEQLTAVVQQAHRSYRDLREGANADYIPELAKVPSELFGVAIVTVTGETFVAGDVDHVFSIQSVSKPFTAALVMQQQGPAALREKIGVEPTGLPFNAALAVELMSQRSVNPLVNAGAMAAVSLVQAGSADARFRTIHDWFRQFAGGAELPVVDDVYRSEAATNQHNVGIAYLLHSYGRLYADPLETVDVYTRQCAIGVTARELALMGATLANSGVNPVTGRRVLDAEHVPRLLAIMMTAGFYDESGLWAYTAGLPAKTGVGGGIVAIVPGRMAIVGFSPRLNPAGNSVRAMKAIEHIGDRFGFNLFAGH